MDVLPKNPEGILGWVPKEPRQNRQVAQNGDSQNIPYGDRMRMYSSSNNKKISLTPKGLLTKSTGEQLQLEINKCYLMDRREIGGDENTVVKITGFTFPSDDNGILYCVSRGDRWSSGLKRNERIAYLHPRIFDSLVETVTPKFDS